MSSQHTPGPSDDSPETDTRLPHPAVTAILIQAIFYPALVLLGGWTSFLITGLLVMMFSLHYAWFPLLFSAPLVILLLATLLLRIHLRSAGFPRHGVATALMVCALLLGVVQAMSVGILGWDSSMVEAIATVIAYTLATAFTLLLYWWNEPGLRPRWKILAMAGAVSLACAVAWTSQKIVYERELDRRVQQHVGYDQMSPVDQEILRQRYERGEEPGLGRPY